MGDRLLAATPKQFQVNRSNGGRRGHAQNAWCAVINTFNRQSRMRTPLQLYAPVARDLDDQLFHSIECLFVAGLRHQHCQDLEYRVSPL